MDRRALIGLAAVTLTTTGAVATSAAASGGGGGGGEASFIRLPTVTATVMRRDGRRGVMTVETGVDVADAALRTRAQQSAPRLSAAYNAVVQSAANALLPDAPPDVERLVAQLQAATNTTLGRAGARLLVGTVMVV